MLSIGIYLGILIGNISGLFAAAFLSVLLQPSLKEPKSLVKMCGYLLAISGSWFGVLGAANQWIKFNNNKEQFINLYFLAILIFFCVWVVFSLIYLLYWQPKKNILEGSGKKEK